MAEIRDGVFGFVSGTVGRSFAHKNGTAFELLVKDAKSQYADKWTVWGELAAVEGDRATVKGWLSTSAETYEKDGVTKAASRRSVNSPTLEAHEPATASVAADSWATAAPADDSLTPF